MCNDTNSKSLTQSTEIQKKLAQFVKQDDILVGNFRLTGF